MPEDADATPATGSAPVPLASALAGGPTAFVRADVALDGEPIVGSFTVDGMTFAVTEDGGSVELVGVSPDRQQVASPQEGDGSPVAPMLASGPDGASLAVPESVAFEGIDYAVASIGAYAFYLSGVTSVSLPASVGNVDERAFRSSDVASVEVDPANESFASYDGILYDADLTRLLLIPGGRMGAARISDKAEEVGAQAFSHCAGVTSISVDAGSDSYSSWEGLLYDADGTTLLRVPAGATDIIIRDGCTTIAAGALEGCAQLCTITAPASVASISPDVFTSVPTVSLPAALAAADGPADSAQADASDSVAPQLNAMVALSSAADDLPEVDPSAIELALEEGADAEAWNRVSFTAFAWVESAAVPSWSAALAEAGAEASTQSSSTYAATEKYHIYHYTTSSTIWWMQTGTGDYGNYSWAQGSMSANTWESFAPTFDSYRFYNGNLYMRVSPVNGTGRVIRMAPSSSSGTWANAKVATDPLGPYTTITPSSSYTTITQPAYIVLWNTGYSVTLSNDGGSGGSASPVSVDPYGAMPMITKPTLSGWTFSGYTDSISTAAPYLYTKADGTPTTRLINANRTVYANWTKTVTFNANGGNQGSLTTLTALKGQPLGKVCTQVSSSDSDYPIRSLFQSSLKPDDNWAPTRNGYVFDGFWTTSASSGGTQWVDAEGNLKVSACSQTGTPSVLYARWVPYELTVDPNGGTVSNPSGTLGTDAVAVQWQGSWTAYGPGSSMAGRIYYWQPDGTLTWLRVTRTGYTLAGWEGIELNEQGEAYSTGRDPCITLKALWTPRTITVTWDANHPDAKLSKMNAPVSSVDISGSYDPNKTLMEVFGTPGFYSTPDGFLFAGWFAHPTEDDGPLTSSTPCPTANVTYYAHWLPAISADVPLEVTARVDLLGIEEQEEAVGYIESRCGEPLTVADVAFEPLSGATELFGAASVADVALEVLAAGSTSPDARFALDASASQAPASAAAFRMAAYGTKVPISYRFAIPDELLPSLTETTKPVCSVAYTVALA